MSEWVYEEGIGENRAILLEHDEIIEAAIELPSTIRAGSVLPARLVRILIPGCRGVATLDGGGEVLIEPLPLALTEGAVFHAEIVREPIDESGRAKLAKGRATNAEPCAGPNLAERLGIAPNNLSVGQDRFEQAGWSELLEQARTGEVPFAGGSLRMSLTPAMILFDVDGNLPPDQLALAGATAAARAIRRFGIGGSIGIDLPTLPDRAARQATATAVDAMLPQPFERTAVNGFGFLQIVRRRERASIPEILRGDPEGAGARALLRRAQREEGHGAITLEAAPGVIARLERHADWIALLERRIGGPVVLRAVPGLAISAGHVQRRVS